VGQGGEPWVSGWEGGRGGRVGARGGAGDCAQAEQVSVAFSVPFSDLSFILRDKAVRSTRPVFGLVFEPVFRVLKGG